MLSRTTGLRAGPARLAGERALRLLKLKEALDFGGDATEESVQVVQAVHAC